MFVGRGGVTDAVAAEVKAQLEARDLVKVRLDRAQAAERGRKEMAEDLASRAGAELVEVRGFMVLLARGGPRP